MPDSDLRLCSLADLEIEDESVDLILTDPPCFSARTSVVAMSGQMHLASVMEHLRRDELDYRWTFNCATPAPNTRMWPLKLWATWKPILWFSKGPASPSSRWMADTIVSANDKRFHHWGQDLSVFEQLTLAFSSRGDLVCDPFLGGGTTAVAALLAGRNFLGCDVDEECLRVANLRVEAVHDYLKVERARVTTQAS